MAVQDFPLSSIRMYSSIGEARFSCIPHHDGHSHLTANCVQMVWVYGHIFSRLVIYLRMADVTMYL
jgi:hypothetical protein